MPKDKDSKPVIFINLIQIPYSFISSLILGSVFFFFDFDFLMLVLIFESYSFSAFTSSTSWFSNVALPTSSLTFDGLIPMFDDPPKFFTDDLLLSDVPFVPIAVLSVAFFYSFFYTDTDFPKFFSEDGLFVNPTLVFFISIGFA